MKLTGAVCILVFCVIGVCVAGRHWHRGRKHRREDDYLPVGGRGRFRLSDMLDRARPWFQGNMRLGPLIDVQWDLLHNAEQQDWWTGRNVCHSEEEREEQVNDDDFKTHHMIGSMSCDTTDTHYRCTREITINGVKKTEIDTFECCHGYTRDGNRPGCTRELDLVDLITTLENLELNDLVRGIDSVALTPLLSAGNYTIFAPVDGSFDVPETEALEEAAMEDNVIMLYPESSDVVGSVRDMLAAHVIAGFHKSVSLYDEQILESVNSAGSTVRINRYDSPRKLVTANCVPITSTDNLATNGVVHKVESLLPPAKQTLYDLIVSDPQFTILKTVLARADYGRELEAEGTLTLFAPTNSAFEKLGTQKIERLLQSGECLRNVLKTHILPHVICSAVIPEGKARTRNILNQYVHVSRSESDKLFVEGAQITSRDKMATNGVMHVIDEVILSENALDMVDALEKRGYEEFLTLLEVADMKKDLVQAENFTLFVPSEQAILDLLDEQEDSVSIDENRLRSVLAYHVVTDGKLTSCHLRNGRELNTLNSTKKIALRQYSSFPFGRNNELTAQCARVLDTRNIESCNGVAHVIDKVLLPPVGDVIDTLSTKPELSIFLDLLKQTSLADELQLTGPFTIFAPTNRYMERLDLERLEANEGRLETFIKSHIMYEILCCAGVFRVNWGKQALERLMAGNDVTLQRTRGDVIQVDGHVVSTCDLTATNGVVHVLDGVLAEGLDRYNQRENRRRGGSSIFDEFDNFDLGGVLPRRPEREFDLDTNEEDWPWWMRRLARRQY